MPGFETLNIERTPATDHVGDASHPPFDDATFDLVYSSHCIEHVEWHNIEATILEWARIVRPSGFLEVHTVNGYAMMKALVDYEETGQTTVKPGAWKRDLHRDDPYKWAVARIMNYDRKCGGGTHWMHRAILTPRYMRHCFELAGLVDLETVAEPRGAKKHRSINMGLRGRKC